MNLKSSPEDFVVRELVDLPLVDSGKYVIFRLKKRDVTTFEAIIRIARALRVRTKDVGFAGLKDRVAVTEQFCSAPVTKDKIESVSLDGIELSFVGFSAEPMFRGQNYGNRFRIVVRDVDLPRMRERFVNLFGKQRFSEQNVEVGRALIKRNWSRVATLLKGQFPVQGDSPLNMIRSFPKNILRLILHAYQSYMWNEAALRWAKNSNPPELVPLIGFGSNPDEMSTKVLAEEGVSPRDFVLRELPDLSVEGAERRLFVEAKDLKYHFANRVLTLEFELPSGSYATVFIDQLFSPL